MRKWLIMDATMMGHPGAHAGTLMNDAEDLIARARRGDTEALRLIFERHHRFIIRFIYGMVGERELAEELTQETFMRAYRSMCTLKGEAKLSTWLCAIAKNVAYQAIRARRKEEHKVEVEDQAVMRLSGEQTQAPDKQFFNKELKRVIHDALEELDEDKRLVFTLKVLQQRSYQEIAEMTGFSIPKLKTDLHRAKAEMRRLIGPYLEVSDEV